MAAVGVVDARVNPNDPKQRIVLWGNGRIDVTEGPQVTDGPSDWYSRPDLPVAVAIHVTNWTTMAGYVLDKQGAFHPFGGAPTLGTKRDEWPSGTKAGEVAGVPYWNTGIYVDWSWDPNNAGRGVVLDGYGTLHAFGGAPAPLRGGYRWPVLAARKLQMSWGPTVIRAYTLDYQGGIHADYSAVAIPASAGAPYWPGQDIARDLVITNWTTGGGYTLDLFGAVHHFGGVQAAIGAHYDRSSDWARVLKVLNPADPLRLWVRGFFAQDYEWVASTAPTVVAGGFTPLSPASTVTGTTRPILAWATSDAQNDSQKQAEVFVFTAAFVAANPSVAANPWLFLWDAVVGEVITDPATRGIASTVDLSNGGHVMYVRVQDTSDLWSAWSSRAWTQAVPLPATPTGVTAVYEPATLSVSLTATTAAGAGDLLRFERTDDGGLTWLGVHGAEAVPRADTTTAADRFPPQGTSPDYRAVRYSIDPRVASTPSASAPADVPVVGHLLHSASNPWLGGEFTVADAPTWTRTSTAGVFQGLDDDYPTVIKDGSRPAAVRTTLTVRTMDAAAWRRLEDLASSRDTLVYRGPFGEVRYCELVGEWGQQQVRAAPTQVEGTPLRHMHATGLPLVEVRPPHLPVVG